eukprot:TRINITY_DN6597_c0_g1_i3.p1 TRINITY_DN6597_c0_g1~~TRINITY_DN6597_c0_g1_i3.p1  ORF type:complete len:324 (-),score=96.58 TRINITY_DN6597_c0_g1_i3:68-1039(-)
MKHWLVMTICLLLGVTVHPFTVEKEHERVLQGRPLSDKEQGDGSHDYDHEAFLGDELAHEFDELEPEESIRRLGVIVEKIDLDGDGYVTVEEMQDWIKKSQARYVDEDTEKQWENYRQATDETQDTLKWAEYREAVYGFLDHEQDGDFVEEGFSYRDMEARDHRRFSLADTDQDGALTKLEFQSFLHPEHADHMRDIVVTETFEDIDKDNDGKISLEEYIGDMYKGGEEGEGEEPEWVASEREQFTRLRDRDGNGYLDVEEVKAWIVPPDFDHSEAEAKHLIFEADVDQDNKLTKEEILDQYDLFVGSQATDFGEALYRHDEF